MIRKLMDFLLHDLWRIRIKTYPPSKSFLINQLRIIVLSFRGFARDNCKLHASAMTLYTMLSMVPIVATMFGIARGFGMEALVKKRIIVHLEGQQEVAEWLVQYADSLLKQAHGGPIAGIGALVLFLAIIKMLGNIEKAFNHIWGVRKARSLPRKVSDYLALMLVCPIFLVLSSSVTVFLTAQANQMTERFQLLQSVGPAITFLLDMLPYAMMWCIFAFAYLFIPNTKVRFSSGIVAGIVAGTVFQVTQWGYVNFQVGVAKYNAIYGGLAALPLFIIWMQLSWLIVLFGCELSFAHQNVQTYEFEPDCLRLKPAFKQLLTLLIMTRLVKRFCSEEEPWQEAEISHDLDIPVRLVRDILFDLQQAHLVSEVKLDDEKIAAYQPARDAHLLTIQYVLDALAQRGAADIPLEPTPELTHLQDSLAQFSTALKASPANITLRDI